MSTGPAYADVEIGTRLPERDITIRRVAVIRYSGAISDAAAVHWSDRVARAVGLPGVIAHGPFTMAQAVRVVTDWVGDPAAVVEFRGRLVRTVPVPDDDVGTTLRLGGVVTDKLHGDRVVVSLTARLQDEDVLSGVEVVVRL